MMRVRVERIEEEEVKEESEEMDFSEYLKARERVKQFIKEVSWNTIAKEVSGVGRVTCEKLSKVAKHPLVLLFHSIPTLADSCGVSDLQVYNIVRWVCERLGISGLVSSKEFYERVKKYPTLKTGVKEVDEVLEIKPRSVYVFWGGYGSGKTQFCIFLSVKSMAKFRDGGLEGITIYIDTEGGFKPERFFEIYNEMKKRGVEFITNKPQVLLVQPTNSYELRNFIANELPLLISKENVALVVVDSIIALPRVEYTGRNQLPSRQRAIMNIMQNLRKIAEVFKIPVVATSHAVASPSSFGTPIKMAGGYTLGHSTNVIVKFENRGGVFKLTVEKGDKPQSAEFTISESGIEPVKRKVRVKK